MEHLKLCESDYRFMTVLWNHAPLASRDLVTHCARELGWKKSTTYTVLKKLCDKGFVQNENSLVTVLIPRERVQAYESTELVDRAFGGSLPSFLVSFLVERKLSEQESETLTRLIDAHREG